MAKNSQTTVTGVETFPRPPMRRPIWVLIFGLALIVLGALAIVMPQVTTLAVELMIGWLFLLSGVVHGWSTFSMRGVWNIAGSAIVAILSLVVGGLLLFNPFEGILTLTMLMVAFFLAAGVVKIYYASRNRHVRGWTWGVVSGIASLAVGVLILLGWPSTAVWALGLLLGIDLFISGWSLVAIYPALREGGSDGGQGR